jgi:hypothetical protein
MLLFHNIVSLFTQFSMFYMKSVVQFKYPAQRPKGYRSCRGRDIVRSSECGSIWIMGISYYSSVTVTQQDRQWTYNVTLRHISAINVAVEKWVLNILNAYLYPYLPSMQCARAILSSVACPTLHYLSMLSHKRRDFRKKKKITNYWT